MSAWFSGSGGRLDGGAKRCTKCRQTKTLNEFHRSVSGRDGRAARCKRCRNEDTRRYMERRRVAESAAEQRGTLLGEGDLA
jgi:hypothetical protein